MGHAVTTGGPIPSSFIGISFMLAIASIALLPTVKPTCFQVGGYIATVFTPVYDDGALALELIRQYAQFLKDNGVDGVAVSATLGEGPTLNLSDSKLVLDAWMEAAKPLNLFVVSSVGSVPLPDAQALANYSQAIGVDAILARPEVYYRPKTPEALVYNIQLIADAAPDTPLIYDDIPEFTGVRVDIEKFFDLATQKIPSFRGVKSTEFQNLILLQNKISGEQKLYATDTFYLAPIAFLGIENYMLDVLSLFPRQVIEIIETAQSDKEGSRERTLTLYERLLDLLYDITEKRNDEYFINKLALMKEAMPIINGLDVGPIRPPQVPPTEDEKYYLLERLRNDNVTIINADT